MPENFKKTTRKYFMAQINRNNNLCVAKKNAVSSISKMM